MKQFMFTFVLVVAAFSPTLGQTTPTQTASAGGDEQAVKQFLTENAAAVGRNDANALERIWSDDYTFVNPSGAVLTKAQRLAELRSGTLKYQSVTPDEMNVRTYGNTAVATSRATIKGQNKGQDMSGQYRVTSVLMKKDGGWQIVAQQSNRIAQQ
jgi:uncharacterized protein (TIGR02246 family)